MDRFTAPPTQVPSTSLQLAEPFLIGHSTAVDLALSLRLHVPQWPWSWSRHVDAH